MDTRFKKGQKAWNKGLKGRHFSPKSEFKKDFIPWNKGGGEYSDETRLKMSLAKKGKPSPKKGIKTGIPSWNRGKINPHWFGKNNPNWKGGVSEFTREKKSNHMGTLEYKVWRRNVFERDKFECQICGESKSGEMQANHIKRYIDYPELRVEPTNGITICDGCAYSLVNNHEQEWESYFNFNLMARGVNL